MQNESIFPSTLLEIIVLDLMLIFDISYHVRYNKCATQGCTSITVLVATMSLPHIGIDTLCRHDFEHNRYIWEFENSTGIIGRNTRIIGQTFFQGRRG